MNNTQKNSPVSYELELYIDAVVIDLENEDCLRSMITACCLASPENTTGVSN